MAPLRDWIALSMAPGLGPAGFWNLVARFGSPDQVLGMSHEALRTQNGLKKKEHIAIKSSDELRARAETELARLKQLGGEALAAEDPAYPELLRQCCNPPPVIYIKGNKNCFTTPAVAVIGSRAASHYGRRIAFTMGQGFAKYGVTVVSGLATGIDSEAHKGVIEAHGVPIGVLGCGLDVVYPRINRRLYHEVTEKGALVSEYVLGTRPEGFRFPARNRIIAGLSRGVVVVEAAKKSGSLITVQHALEEGREVFAIPGQVDSLKSGGTHWLLQQGASLAVSVDDVVNGIGLEDKTVLREKSLSPCHKELDEANSELLAMIDTYPINRNDLIEMSGYAPAEISEYLLLLELEGLIELLPGDRIRRIKEL